MHEVGLALSQHSHFFNRFATSAVGLYWRLQTMDYTVGVLVLPFLKMPLHLLWVVKL